MQREGDAVRHTCPVCAYGGLFEPPWVADGPSDEICPQCGTQFGYDDATVDAEDRARCHAVLRRAWIHGGERWWSTSRTAGNDVVADEGLTDVPALHS